MESGQEDEGHPWKRKSICKGREHERMRSEYVFVCVCV